MAVLEPVQAGGKDLTESGCEDGIFLVLRNHNKILGATGKFFFG